MKKIILASMAFFLLLPYLVQARDVPFTQEDRDRIIRLEEGQKSLQKQIDELRSSLQRQIVDSHTSLQRQIDDIKTFLLWGFGILFSLMSVLIGFVLWDRRTAVAPVIQRTERIELALKQLAIKNPEISEALRQAGLL
ncbi:MAG: hypothetical protein HY879_28090 [Deltaproteobacteria bacterium]|nr:hypothetical protein [Deltaproteobacteria bacterium]